MTARERSFYALHIQEVVYGEFQDEVTYQGTSPTDSRISAWFDTFDEACNWVDEQIDIWENEMENTVGAHSYEMFEL